jgi:hypothetical protein
MYMECMELKYKKNQNKRKERKFCTILKKDMMLNLWKNKLHIKNLNESDK